MVDAVRKYFDANGMQPNSFYYEKFTQNVPLKESA
jgi:benzoate/toluate 1,2-dioxygenase reductase subunit